MMNVLATNTGSGKLTVAQRFPVAACATSAVARSANKSEKPATVRDLRAPPCREFGGSINSSSRTARLQPKASSSPRDRRAPPRAFSTGRRLVHRVALDDGGGHRRDGADRQHVIHCTTLD